MIDKRQLRSLVSETLKEIELYSEDAVNLILGTIAQESAGGQYIRQLNNGPALGICQMEPSTFNDHLSNYLKYKKSLVAKINESCNIDYFNASILVFNLKFSICMCRVHYLRVPSKLPSNLYGYAKYWKDHYNTYLGAGTEDEFIKNYKKYVL